MRKLLFILPFILVSSLLMGQSAGIDNSVVLAQAGSSTISNGKSVIKLSDYAIQMMAKKEITVSYYVSITPDCNCGQFYVSEKGDKSFTVEQTGNANGTITFDYVVYLRFNLKPATK